MKNRILMLKIAFFIIMFSFAWFHSGVAMADAQMDEPGAEAVAEPEPASTEPEIVAEPELVSTGAELMEWMESHKNVGGTVKLGGSVVLDGYCCFCPDGNDMPSVFVETDGYSITVTGETEFWSDGHLIFRGPSGEQGLFRVAAGGQLTLHGVTVEGGQCALWQEEGAGLVVDHQCQVSGAIHYADTPFVYEYEPVYVIVERGQTADNAFPSEVTGIINYQGQVAHGAKIPVTWNLEGTGTKRDERKRFSVQGSFFPAASREPAFCTVIYNDYPLTFLEVKAVASSNTYRFQGWYAIPEEKLPITVSSEYSFDGTSWNEYEKVTVSSIWDGFVIGIRAEQWDTGANPYIYIRLKWNDGGTCYFSNVLRYAADNLENAEDQGGSRGGGTSIVNPPEEPRQEPSDKLGKDPSDEPRGNAPEEPGQESPDKPGKNPLGEPRGDEPDTSRGNPPEELGQEPPDKTGKNPLDDLQGNPPNEPQESPLSASQGNPPNEQQGNLPGSSEENPTDALSGYRAQAGNQDNVTGIQPSEEISDDVEAAEYADSGQEQVRPRQSAAEKSGDAVSKIYDGRLPGNIVGTGFLTLFIFGVAAGFCLYMGRLRKYFHIVKKTLSK